MLKMTFFWLLFRGKFEQKTQKSISFKNQWRLKNIKKTMVVKNIIAEDMAFTKSIFEQFWRSYCKITIFVVFHFLKFLPSYILPLAIIDHGCCCNSFKKEMVTSKDFIFFPLMVITMVSWSDWNGYCKSPKSDSEQWPSHSDLEMQQGHVLQTSFKRHPSPSPRVTLSSTM